jgi:hypothetical protein
MIFHKYEPEGAIRVLSLILGVPAALSWRVWSIYSGLMAIPFTFLSYLFLLTFFTITYRISPFHPLAKFPGPFISRISKFWIFHVMQRGDLHRYHTELHHKYGDMVRIGESLCFCLILLSFV